MLRNAETTVNVMPSLSLKDEERIAIHNLDYTEDGNWQAKKILFMEQHMVADWDNVRDHFLM